jgi:[ribosomal protein S5]-alanine N-acetyltransferase
MEDGQITIKTERFILKRLEVKDASHRYLSWFDCEDVKTQILVSTKMRALEDLELYIEQKINSKNTLFFGIFCLDTGLHIGNIKYEPIDRKNKYAILGILIGDKAYRGKKVAFEVIKASGKWLSKKFGISMVILEVDPSNIPAIKAYKSLGFIREESEYTFKDNDRSLTMIWYL